MSTRPKSTQRVKSQTVTLTTTEFDSSSKNTPHTYSQRRVRPKTVPAKPSTEIVKSSHLSTDTKIRIGIGQNHPERKLPRDGSNGEITGKSKAKIFTKRTVSGNKKAPGVESRASDVDTDRLNKTEQQNVTRRQSSSCSQETPSNEQSDQNSVSHTTKREQPPDSSSDSSRNGSDKVNENLVDENVEQHVIENAFDGRYFTCSVDSDVTTPWLVGLAYVKSGDIICLDLNNERIKRFDKNLKMVSSIEVPFDCSGMTITSPDEVAVTCLNEIHFYNVGKFGMNRTAKYITVNGMAHGIAHDQNWFAVTCDITEPEESTLRVIDETGSEHCVIDPPIVSELPLKFASFLALDKSRDRIFISDSAPSRVVCINFRGEPLWDTSIPGGSRGIVSFNVDNILVCDQFSEKVRLLTTEGALKSDVISAEDGLCNPDLVARRPDSNDVIVSYGGFGTVGLFSVQL